MKINIVFLWKYNNKWIWGWDRKFWIYYKNLNTEHFNKFFIYITENEKIANTEWNEVIITQCKVMEFLKSKNIDYVYFAWANLWKDLENKILEKYIWLINVNFTPRYIEDPRILNLLEIKVYSLRNCEFLCCL